MQETMVQGHKDVLKRAETNTAHYLKSVYAANSLMTDNVVSTSA